jgi:replicative DNA helicase
MNLQFSQWSEQQLQTEQAVLGAVFIKQEVLEDLHELQPDDFINRTHSLIFKVMRYLHEIGEGIDIVSLVNHFNVKNKLDQIGGVSYLMQLAEACPSASNATQYARYIRDRSNRRRIRSLGQRIMELSESEAENEHELFNQVDLEVIQLRPESGGKMQHVSQTRQNYFDVFDKESAFIQTGFRSFDSWAGGIARKSLYILAGRPSVGKTARALQMALGIAQQGAGDVLVYSQEMDEIQVKDRLIAPIAGINYGKLRRNKRELDADEMNRIGDAYSFLESLPLHISDAAGVSIEEVRAAARQLKRMKGKIGAIFVDYLTIMKIETPKNSTYAKEVGNVALKAKWIAQELDCPFIMLAQMSREGAKGGGRPELHHLKESGDIEQHADMVEFLWMDEKDTHRDGKVVQSYIAKGRDAGTNEFRYLFKGYIQKYEDLG